MDSTLHFTKGVGKFAHVLSVLQSNISGREAQDFFLPPPRGGTTYLRIGFVLYLFRMRSFQKSFGTKVVLRLISFQLIYKYAPLGRVVRL